MYIITSAEPHQTKLFSHSLLAFTSRIVSGLMMISLQTGDVLKCADNQNSIGFIFPPHGFPVYMNIKHEMQPTASKRRQAITVCKLFTRAAFIFILIVSFHMSSKSFHVFLRVKLYVDCGFGVWLFLQANAEKISQTF